MRQAVYRCEGGALIPSPMAGSFWGPGIQHGGPPAAMLARAVEQAVTDPDFLVCRLTIDLMRPVPLRPMRATARTVRAGRRLRLIDAALLVDDVVVCRASALALRGAADSVPSMQTQAVPFPGPDALAPAPVGSWAGLERSADGYFHTSALELRRWEAPAGAGRKVAWLRLTRPLVEGEALTPLQRVAAHADSLGAVAELRGEGDAGFINADITAYLHRLPVGEWIGIETRAVVEPTGLGVIQATLYDIQGAIGAASQTRMLNRRR